MFNFRGTTTGRMKTKEPNTPTKPRSTERAALHHHQPPKEDNLDDLCHLMKEFKEDQKLKFVIFEGPDKSGKSTLFQAFRRRTKYQPLAIERFTGSNFVYDKFYNRPGTLELYLEQELYIQEVFNCYLVVLLPDDEVLEERILNEEVGKDKEIALANYSKIGLLFEDYYYNKTNFTNKMIMNTGRLSVEEAVDQICHFIDWEG